MSSTSYRQLTLNGLWKNNPALVQLLGLCPLLAVTASTVNALGLAAATLFVLVVSNTSVSLIRLVVSDTIRLPVFVMIIAAAVTVTELLMQAYSYELYQILGIFLPLITTNCIILGRADAFARKNALPAASSLGLACTRNGLTLSISKNQRVCIGQRSKAALFGRTGWCDQQAPLQLTVLWSFKCKCIALFRFCGSLLNFPYGTM